ncbi:DegT/DnrJ/EryC1/StrS family aminotransferase OS=Streptomyces microflavus OX=1919 GN=G3I39_34450 PE=3 SV=1 [Streptomyces microflavus]
MPLHPNGHPAAIYNTMPIAEKHQLAVVEDACQAHAASPNGTPVGASGAGRTFSFNPPKNMHSLEGGFVSTGRLPR